MEGNQAAEPCRILDRAAEAQHGELAHGFGDWSALAVVGYRNGYAPPRTEMLGSERLTGALLDRLTHHVHILGMNGESYRLAQSKRRRQTASSPDGPRPPATE